MHYRADTNRIEIRADELIALALGTLDGFSATDAISPSEGRSADASLPTVSLSGEFEEAGLVWLVRAEVPCTGSTIVLTFPFSGAAPSRTLVRHARGKGFLAAHLLGLSDPSVTPSITLRYQAPDGETIETSETPTPSALGRFALRALSLVRERAAAEIERVTRRLPSMARVRFPYGEVREGQRELISACYRAIRKGERLYASAPTGIGKTISTLFPAVRAMGEGACEKIFYLTAKATTAAAAAEAAEQLRAAGAELRVLLLSSRERICRNRLACRDLTGDGCPLSRYAPSREEAAARELLALGKTVIDAEDLRQIGHREKLCPYELSLRYAMLADVVICDYNYLFDPRVALRRFFSEPNPAYCFLIDEAHNLAERSRELYSLTLSAETFAPYLEFFSKTPALDAAYRRFELRFREILMPLVEDESELREGVLRGFSSQSELPSGLDEAFYELLSAIEELLSKRELPPLALAELSRISYELSDLAGRFSLYSPKYRSFILREGDSLTYRTLCLDPSEILASRLSLGGSAVLFSATLTPTDYYRTVLGGKPSDAELDLPSPFDPEHLCVAVLDRISTRYGDREASLLAVARAILTAVKAKPGNYLVFCPSFAYLQALSGVIERLAPRLALVKQQSRMTGSERQAFLSRFSEENRSALIGLAVLGGIFSEGVDLVGRRLIGSIVIGVGLPQPSPEREAIRAYYEDALEAGREFAYHYPGMNRVLQAAGRVIRSEDDRGVILLIDDRYGEPLYREMIPRHWRSLKYVGDLKSLSHLLERFWKS